MLLNRDGHMGNRRILHQADKKLSKEQYALALRQQIQDNRQSKIKNRQHRGRSTPVVDNYFDQLNRNPKVQALAVYSPPSSPLKDYPSPVRYPKTSQIAQFMPPPQYPPQRARTHGAEDSYLSQVISRFRQLESLMKEQVGREYTVISQMQF